MGRYQASGEIEILGREDNQVKINGYRIELGEVEAALLQHPNAGHVVIHTSTHPKTGHKQLAAWIVDSGEAGRDRETEYRQLAQQLLPAYMLPNWYTFVERIPLTANGKVDRNALPSVWSACGDETAQPGSEREAFLLTLWQEEMEHSEFSITDGFFDIGGDSLHAVSLLATLRAAFQVDPSREQEMIESLFMNASVRDFARILADTPRVCASGVA
ncbi:non-ribosomal peptide synthetase [Pantoea sp. 1.19]|uniref:non-ribosomal peptide synthetase n=1 Tax=Pantoea sp. 1.19 TaxID=1925589 RepID=UPI000A94BC79